MDRGCGPIRNRATLSAAAWLCPLLAALSLFGGEINRGRPERRAPSGTSTAADFYVATDGNDSWSGTLASPNAGHSDGPFASVAKAQLAVRNLIKTKPKSVTVMLRAGTYYLPLSPTSPGTLNFTASDSGSATMPVTWENYPEETPAISGGGPIGAGGLGLTWSNVSGALWQVQLPSGTQPFEYLFYNGERRLRSRVQSSAGVGYYMKGSSCYSTQTKAAVDISLCNLGSYLRIAATIAPSDALGAGCPNVTDSTDSTSSKCLDRFKYNPSDPIMAWQNLNPTTVTGQTCTLSGNNAYPKGDVEVTIFNAWTVDVMRVSCVDTANHVVYLTGAAQGSAGNFVTFGLPLGHRYIVENTRDTFDAAHAAGQTGLWFLDRSKAPWVLNYLANSGENPNTDSVVIAQVQPVSSNGGSLIAATSLKYVTFRGITFEVDNFLPPPGGFNTDENDEAALPEAIDCESCQYVTFDGVTVRRTSASGILFASISATSGSPATNDVIENSAFYDIGDSGIRIGHQKANSDKAANVVQFITLENNVIQGYSRVFADGEGVAQSDGHDVLISHNDIFDGYHAGISICDTPCYGNPANGSNVISQYNHIWNVMQAVTSDGGTLYYSIGGPTSSGTGNKMLNNLLHDTTDSSIIDSGIKGTGYGGFGLYVDGESAGVDLENNVVFHMAETTGVMYRGPVVGQPANTFKNNILAYGQLGMFRDQEPWAFENSGPPTVCDTPSLRYNFINNILYFDLNRSAPSAFEVYQGCTYTCGLSFNNFQNIQGNLYWRTDGGFANYDGFGIASKQPSDPTNCEWIADTNFNFSTWQSNKTVVMWNGSPAPPGGFNEDMNGTVTTPPGFGSTGTPADYCIPAGCSGGKIVGNLDTSKTNDTILHAGREPGSYPATPATVPETFPTYTWGYTPVTVNTSPTGLQVVVDTGAPQTAPAIANLPQSGSLGTHTLSVASPQYPAAGEQAVFQKWNDGNTSATRTIAVPASAKTYTATFQANYQLNVIASPAEGGTVMSASGNFYPAGTTVTISAAASPGYVFSGWTGTAAGADSPHAITMDQPHTVVANFAVQSPR